MRKRIAISVATLFLLALCPALSAEDSTDNSNEAAAFGAFIDYRTAIVDPASAPHEYFSREFLGYFLDAVLRGADEQIPLARRVSRFTAALRFGRRVEVVHDFAEMATADGSRLLIVAFTGRMVDSPAVYELRMVIEQGRWRFDHIALDVTPTAVSERGLSSDNVLLSFE